MGCLYRGRRSGRSSSAAASSRGKSLRAPHPPLRSRKSADPRSPRRRTKVDDGTPTGQLLLSGCLRVGAELLQLAGPTPPLDGTCLLQAEHSPVRSNPVLDSEFLRRAVPQRAGRSFGVVLDAPRFDHPSGMRETQEPVFVQAFVTEFA